MNRLITAAIALPVLIASIIFPPLKMAVRRLAVAAVVDRALRVLVPLEARRGEAGRGRGLRGGGRAARRFLLQLGPTLLCRDRAAARHRGARGGDAARRAFRQDDSVRRLDRARRPLRRAARRAHDRDTHGLRRVYSATETYLVGAAYVEQDALDAPALVLLPRADGLGHGRVLHRAALGKHKLAPGEPGKTWEGAFGGMAASLLVAALAHYWFFPELP